MKNTILIIGFLLLSALLAEAQTIDTYKVRASIIQSFPTEDIRHLVLELEGQISVQVWGQTGICVQTSIIPDKSGFKAVKMLAEEGYYDVTAADKNDQLIISSKQAVSKLLKYKDTKQVICIEYKIYIPEGVQVTDVFGSDLPALPLVTN